MLHALLTGVENARARDLQRMSSHRTKTGIFVTFLSASCFRVFLNSRPRPPVVDITKGQTRARHSLQSPRCGVPRQRKRGGCSAFQPPDGDKKFIARTI
eukprot:sb/3478570/